MHAFGRHPRRGLTAIEIAMVATVLAILALVILPVYRQRTEEARKAAAQDELRSIVNMMILVEADLENFTPRLQDLDNVENLGSGFVDSNLRSTEPPYAEWNRTLGYNVGGTATAPDERATKVVPNWRGPYLAVRRFAEIQSIEALIPDAIYPDGPIYVVGANGNSPTYDNPGGSAITDDPADRYPVDPWGNPYLLFGRGRLSADTESTFNSRVVYTTGPDGLPGDGSAGTFYLRRGDRFLSGAQRGILGTGDDYEFIF
ncbi:MAG: hypothetical protein SF028_06145 [Candidatus Sumerlaeia bacterium]|nr:hypothetical protein [Candidatus Sumerlaeia bacterium]